MNHQCLRPVCVLTIDTTAQIYACIKHSKCSWVSEHPFVSHSDMCWYCSIYRMLYLNDTWLLSMLPTAELFVACSVIVV